MALRGRARILAQRRIWETTAAFAALILIAIALTVVAEPALGMLALVYLWDLPEWF